MSAIPQSAFNFSSFQVVKSLFEIKGSGDHEISIRINPTGVIFPSLSQFQLRMETFITDANNTLSIELVSISTYDFPEDADIEDYKKKFFIHNAPAITFPYLRSYIGALTALSGFGTVLLPTLNMSSLAETLYENIEIAE